MEIRDVRTKRVDVLIIVRFIAAAYLAKYVFSFSLRVRISYASSRDETRIDSKRNVSCFLFDKIEQDRRFYRARTEIQPVERCESNFDARMTSLFVMTV